MVRFRVLHKGEKRTSTAQRSDQYWSQRWPVLLHICDQYWSTRRPVLVRTTSLL